MSYRPFLHLFELKEGIRVDFLGSFDLALKLSSCLIMFICSFSIYCMSLLVLSITHTFLSQKIIKAKHEFMKFMIRYYYEDIHIFSLIAFF